MRRDELKQYHQMNLDSRLPALAASALAVVVLCGSSQAEELARRSTLAPAVEPALVSDSVNVDEDATPLVTGTGMLPGFVVAGQIDSAGKVPAFNGVAGSAVPNVDVSFPLTLLTHGVSYCITVAFQDINVTGAYEVDYYITKVVGGVTKKLVDETLVTGKTSNPTNEWAWSINAKAIPDSPGVATLVGRVRWGTNFATQAIVSSKIVIQ